MSVATRVALVMLACAIGAAVPAPARAADLDGQLEFGGTARTYRLHVPDRAPPPGGFALVLAFHGGGMQGAGMQRLSGFDRVADDDGLMVAYPNGIDRHWNDGRATVRNPQDDVGFVAALIDALAHRYAVDRARVYATGISNGALFVERLGCELSAQVSAIAPVAGSMPADIASRCRPGQPVAVMQIDGTADPIMPFDGGTVADLGGAGLGGQVLSVPDTAALWARLDGCGAPGTPEALAPIAPPDRTRIARRAYTACPAAGQVSVLAVLGGGHAWPGGPQYARPRLIGLASHQLDASRAIAAFFLATPAR